MSPLAPHAFLGMPSIFSLFIRKGPQEYSISSSGTTYTTYTTTSILLIITQCNNKKTAFTVTDPSLLIIPFYHHGRILCLFILLFCACLSPSYPTVNLRENGRDLTRSYE